MEQHSACLCLAACFHGDINSVMMARKCIWRIKPDVLHADGVIGSKAFTGHAAVWAI